MADSPRFSITIPAYNAAATLGETIDSVLSQSFKDWEIVIVDDGSTDDTRALAERCASRDSRIRVVHQENRGSGGAYNTAVRNARSDLLVMLSADDLLLPEHLSQFDRFVREHSDAAIFTATGYYEYEDGTREPSVLHEAWADSSTCSIHDLLNACFFGTGAVYRREAFDAIGGFREDIYAEDYGFWLGVMVRGFRHRFLNQRLAVHRRNVTQKSADVVRVRQADVRAIQDAIDTGLLSPEQLSVAMKVIRRHRRNIGIRCGLARVLGQKLSGSLLAQVGLIRQRVATRREGR